MFAKRALRPLSYAAVLAAALFATGCAQTPITEDSARASTLTDAQEHARGGRDRGHASSQWALGFGDKKTQSAAQSEQSEKKDNREVSELAKSQTFLGTIACAPSNTTCVPIRLLITLHPDGVWRLRASDTNQSRAPIVDQGCWHKIGSNPNRIILQTQNDTVLGDMSFTNPNQLRINVFNYLAPTLETHLSRQPELDSVVELENQTGPICRP